MGMVAGLEPPAVKSDAKKDKNELHMRKQTPTTDAETDSLVAMRAAMRFQHHGGCLRLKHGLIYLDHCNRSDIQSTWIMTPTGMLMGGMSNLCMDAGELMLARTCDATNDRQQWTISGDLGVRIKSGSGQCLGSRWTTMAPSAKVYVSACNSDDFAQEWTIEQTQVPVEEIHPVDLHFVALFAGSLMAIEIP